MGLCKCPKRRVTNQFCFEHRVNVCEHCMVSNHSKCIIQSYLQWLQDSDYNPICELCMKELHTEDCIRLTCYHVFHWACLDRSSRQLPPTTAPAGYTCPSCRAPLFPQSNLVSPVADVLREKLAGVNWARAGLGLPLLSEDREIKPVSLTSSINGASSSNHNMQQNVAAAAAASQQQQQYSVVHVDDQVPFSREKTEVYQAARRVFQDIRETRGQAFDHDDDKYKRRPPGEWMKRWWKNAIGGPHHRTSSGSIYKRYIMLTILVVLAIGAMLLILSSLGQHYTDNDPNLDPVNNPHLKTQQRLHDSD